jgi:Tol biopolymer transport system component
MTTEARFERLLPTILEDLYLGPFPDYRNEVLAAATRTRQRPAWTFPGRWLPMADIATRPTLVPRLPWRAIGVALVIVTLLAVAAFAIVGSRQTKLPPPFGPAGNGLVLYSSGGDIYTVDPRTNVTRAIVTGQETDSQPEFSPDGTKFSFVRPNAANCCMSYDILVAAADGTGARVINPDHPVTDNDYSHWSPDSTAILVGTAQGSLLRLDATGAAAPVIVAEGVRFVGEARPPDGAQILYDPDSTPEIDLWIMNADGTSPRVILPASALTGSQWDLSAVNWSPNGKMIAFTCGSPTNADVSHLCVMNADGTDVRRLTNESDAWFESDLAWSPDSTRIAFNRWYTDPATGMATVRPIGVASITGGAVVDTGPTPVSDGGALFNWSPDGTILLELPTELLHSPSGAAPARPLAIDVANGSASTVDWEVRGEASWQRVAE